VLRSYNIDPDEATAHKNAGLLLLFCLSLVARMVGYVRMYVRYVLEDDWRNLRGEDPDAKAAAVAKKQESASLTDQEPPEKVLTADPNEVILAI